ncbi:hypothetical protein QBC40DRAFT_327713 [Triangularia verruculosa]|uniref:Actin-like ATPase domain-containing protein n=1 Tax=Triangularia verruculosa TaxID=2587418 RepID=A0AAN6XGQ5_9PEZI|nr:hypothetical protein QBC40DRAFT_327713 [Triangularia verruculosa]
MTTAHEDSSRSSSVTNVAPGDETSPPPTPSTKYGASKDFIAIGIDLGTTYSGVSWTPSREWNPDAPGCIYDVMNWPVDHNNYAQRRDEAHVPTVIDPETGKWGYCVSSSSDPIRWFKLLLLDEKHAEKDVRRSKQLGETRSRLAESARYKKTGLVGLVADFLRGIWEHTLEEIERQEDLTRVHLKVAITIPAMWTENARTQMEEAAFLAGITQPATPPTFRIVTLTWVQEPVAAALCTLRELRLRFEVGETFMVCDCGGGTVDIITFTVESLHPLQFTETIPESSAGKLCGAFLIDQAFENHIMSGRRPQSRTCSSKDFRDFTEKAWEYGLKRAFSDKLTESCYLELPSGVTPRQGLDRFIRRGNTTSTITIPKPVIEQWFAASYTGIRLLIGEQHKKLEAANKRRPSKIFLVGGLGSSQYLHSKLNKQFKNIMQVKKTWSAVARGATMAVLEGMPVIYGGTKTTPQSYGIQALVDTEAARPRFQPCAETMYVGNDGALRVERMLWYLTLGGGPADFEDQRASHWVYIDLEDEGVEHITIEVYMCTSEETPGLLNSSVQRLCLFRCPVRAVRGKGDWKRFVDERGRRIHRLNNVCLSMKFDGDLKCTLQVGDDLREQELDAEYIGESEKETVYEGRCRIGLI